jgi:hypothetical protein
MNIELQIGHDVILSYRRLSYTAWHALAEFADNSTQSYFNNKDVLDKAYAEEKEKLYVRIVYDKSVGRIRLSDNAMGMSFEELQDALKLGKVPTITSGRSQFGLGMKTAACWLGNRWIVRTKKLGEDLEHEVVVDVESVATGKSALPHTARSKDPKLHYTIIEIEALNTNLAARTLWKTKDFLRSMYRSDIRNGILDLFWEEDKLEWQDEQAFLRSRDGQQYKRQFEFFVDGKKVHGWVGILEAGSRSRAGFSILRRGRVVRGHPDAWRPEEIFGQMQGSNDLINQRLVGEINLDDFDVSHTKDDILWREDQEDKVQSELAQACRDYMKIAREHRKSGRDERRPSETEVQAAVDELKNEMQSKEFVDKIELEDVPPPEIVEKVVRPIIEAAERSEPRFKATIGSVTCKVYLSTDNSPNDPYFATDVTSDEILVVVNTRHPHWSQIVGSEGVLNYLRHCVYDAVAEWQCWRKSATIRHDTIKILKDSLLRLPSEIEQGA